MLFSGIRQRNQFAILTPHKLAAPGIFRNAEPDNSRHDELLAAMQRLRGRTYLNDGANPIAREELKDAILAMMVDKFGDRALSWDGRVVS